jgi:hypothetical protein
MRTFIFTLAAIVPVQCVIGQAQAADRLPAFDIARNCKAEAAGAITWIEACTKAETHAKNELEKRWSQFGASEKRSCVGMSSTGGERSYVELLTYLEMSTGQLPAPAIVPGEGTVGTTFNGGFPPEAPVGHRQPRASDVPHEKNLANPRDWVSKENAMLEKKIKSICRGC